MINRPKEWHDGVGLVDPKTGKSRARLYKLEEGGYDPVVHKPEDEPAKMEMALSKSREWGPSSSRDLLPKRNSTHI